MKNRLLTALCGVSLLCLVIVMVGCCISTGCCCNAAKYEKTVQLSEPLQPGSEFAAQTHNGSITVNGVETEQCNLTAKIIARAPTEEEAKKLGEEIVIKLERSGSKLTAKIEKPACMRNRSVSVNLNVAVPRQTDLKLTTHNGAAKIADITGNTKATTHNGAVSAAGVCGNTELQTHNGAVTCKDVSGDSVLTTHNGSVKAYYSAAASPACSVSIVTHNGSAEFVAPPKFAGSVEASTHNGSINTKLPITVIGKLSKRKLVGTIGQGQGKLNVKTYNGSIRIR